MLRGDKSLSLKPKFEYILSFVAALLACGNSKALVYTSIKVLAIRGSLALLVPISFASSNAKVTIVLGSGKLIAILGLLHKN